MKKEVSLNSYSHHAPKMDWLRQYFEFKNEFDTRNSLGKNMRDFFGTFLRDARLLDDSGFSKTAEMIDEIGYTTQTAWGIIYVNLCHPPQKEAKEPKKPKKSKKQAEPTEPKEQVRKVKQVEWYVSHVDIDTEYPRELLESMMVDAGAKESWTSDIFGSIKRLSELPMGDLGFGHVIKVGKTSYITRGHWHDPIPEVVLYGLYRFAEACDHYYQFTLETLLDDSIERDGISPTRIFGLDRKTMVPILNGLTSSYPDFISASFTLDLDNITLRENKTAEDVLELFKGGSWA